MGASGSKSTAGPAPVPSRLPAAASAASAASAAVSTLLESPGPAGLREGAETLPVAGDAAADSAKAAPPAAAAAAAAAAREQRLRAAELEARARVLSTKVRCVECGHQSIEDSNADVAVFMRKMIRDELSKGRQEGEILDTLKDKYGDSVVYSPPFQGASAALWLTPVFVLAAAAASAAVRRRPLAAGTAATAATAAQSAVRHAHAMPRRAVRSRQTHS
ncbi:hypothetical protein CLOM_g10982 [Closterium sp. NIES-68]|nr:hypothetical protein CLOM_g10982 [Closterium sp. NIES-68]